MFAFEILTCISLLFIAQDLKASIDEGASFEYAPDPDYVGPVYPSLPTECKRGVLYTPPGWKRVYCKKNEKDISVDSLFE